MKSFKDSKRVYLLLEYIPGLSLNIILKDAGLLTVKDSMFYIGSLIIVLQYLHERDVIRIKIKATLFFIKPPNGIK